MYIYGKNVSREKINSGEKINKIYLYEKFNDKELFDLIKKNKIKFNFVPNRLLDSKVDGLHQGIILDVDDVKSYEFDYIRNLNKTNPIIVMLDHLEDPHNFGAIIRTCEALGIDGIIIPNDRSVNINGTVVKTSVGAIYNMPVCLVIGNEGKGISKIIKDNCDFMATIPMSGNINSLNASVSCGIILSRIVSSRG